MCFFYFNGLGVLNTHTARWDFELFTTVFGWGGGFIGRCYDKNKKREEGNMEEL